MPTYSRSRTEAVPEGRVLSALLSQEVSDMMPRTGIALSASNDSTDLNASNPAPRVIEWTIHATNAATRTLIPLNLAFVLDCYDVAQRVNAYFVQQAVSLVLDELNLGDRVAVIACRNGLQVLQPSAEVSDETRWAVMEQFAGWHTERDANLVEGWQEGCLQITAGQQLTGINRTILLTTGASQVDDSQAKGWIARIKRQLKRDATTTVIGIGPQVDEMLLAKVATEGGGHYYYVEQPEALPAYLRQEVQEMRNTIAREVMLTVGIPVNSTVTLAGNVEVQRTDERLRISLGDLSLGVPQSVYTRIQAPAGAVGNNFLVHAYLSYATPVSQTAGMVSATATFNYRAGKESKKAVHGEEVLRYISEVEMANVLLQALALEGRGDDMLAHCLLAEALQNAAPHLTREVQERYEELCAAFDAGLSTEQRKRAHYHAYATLNSRPHKPV